MSGKEKEKKKAKNGHKQKKQRIRPLALCVFCHNDRLLVSEGYDNQKKQRFYRPLGGGVEFGELSQEAAVREIKEEIGADVTNLRFLGLAENIFNYQESSWHEVVMLYQADFVDPALYEKAEFIFSDGNEEEKNRAVWVPIADFAAGKYPLFPDGLLSFFNPEASPQTREGVFRVFSKPV